MEDNKITIQITKETLNTIHLALDYTKDKYTLYKADEVREEIKQAKQELIDEYYKFIDLRK